MYSDFDGPIMVGVTDSVDGKETEPDLGIS